MAFLTSQLHNFAMQLGYTLDNGVTALVGGVVESNKKRFRDYRVPNETYGSDEIVINVSKTWIEAAYGDSADHAHYEAIIQNYARVLVYFACIVANTNGRKRVKACDVALLKSFLEAMNAFS